MISHKSYEDRSGISVPIEDARWCIAVKRPNNEYEIVARKFTKAGCERDVTMYESEFDDIRIVPYPPKSRWLYGEP